MNDPRLADDAKEERRRVQRERDQQRLAQVLREIAEIRLLRLLREERDTRQQQARAS